MGEPGDITLLLREVELGREGAMDRLMERVYSDLERIALAQLSRRFGSDVNVVTIEPAALVNESFLRLIRQRRGYANRDQFFAIATKVMLRVLVDYQRERFAACRGGGKRGVHVSIVGAACPSGRPGRSTEIAIDALVQALDQRETLDARQAEVVKMRVVWGLEIGEIAEALGISPTTVKRDWRFAKAWLMDRAAPIGK